MKNSIEEDMMRELESYKISASVDEWKDVQILNLIYLLIVDRVLHERFIEDLCDKIRIAKVVALDFKFYEEIDNDSGIQRNN